MCSAWESHFALPSFSVMEPSNKNTCVTTIFDTDDCPELLDVEEDRLKAERSKLAVVGDVKLFDPSEGEKVEERALPPPLLLPPPPPVAVDTDEAVAPVVVTRLLDANGVVVRDRGDVSDCEFCWSKPA